MPTAANVRSRSVEQTLKSWLTYFASNQIPQQIALVEHEPTIKIHIDGKVYERKPDILVHILQNLSMDESWLL